MTLRDIPSHLVDLALLSGGGGAWPAETTCEEIAAGLYPPPDGSQSSGEDRDKSQVCRAKAQSGR